MATRCASVSAETAEVTARAAADHLLADADFAGAARVALYAALPAELPTRSLFAALAASGRVCLFPRVEASDLVFARVERWEDLRPGRYGVAEPPEGAKVAPPGAEDAVVVPGVAFDRAGNRLGRGRGYYDRAFPPGAGSAPRLFGFAHDLQVVDDVPHDARDRRMDAVVTESGVHRITEKPA